MIYSLRFRLYIAPVVVVLVAVGTMALFISLRTSWELKRYVERDNIVATLLNDYRTNQNQPNIQTQVERLGQASGDRIVLTDPQGHVLADSERQLIGQQVKAQASPRASNPGQGTQPSSSSLPSLDATSTSLPIPVLPLSSVPLVAYFGTRGDQQFNLSEIVLLQSVNQSLAIAAAAAIGIGLVLSLALSRRILVPIETLTPAAQRMEQGDLSQRVPVASKDEIGALTRAFNTMAESLVRLEQLRQNMVNDVAHELRTPLTNIRGFLEALQDGLIQPNSELIASLYDETMLLNRLVNDLQDLALAEAGQIQLVRQPINLEARIMKTIGALQHKLTSRKIVVDMDLPADLPLVDADSERLGQVLANLLNNAVVHMPTGGRITIAATPDVRDVIVRIHDTGSGIAAEDLPYIFERFFRADRSRSRATGGAGLGLTIVKQLLTAHGGIVQAESEPGLGTTFTFTLPIAD